MDFDDESDDISSSSSSSPSESLEHFRAKWQQELTASSATNQQNKTTPSTTGCENPNNSNDQVNMCTCFKFQSLL